MPALPDKSVQDKDRSRGAGIPALRLHRFAVASLPALPVHIMQASQKAP